MHICSLWKLSWWIKAKRIANSIFFFSDGNVGCAVDLKCKFAQVMHQLLQLLWLYHYLQCFRKYSWHFSFFISSGFPPSSRKKIIFFLHLGLLLEMSLPRSSFSQPCLGPSHLLLSQCLLLSSSAALSFLFSFLLRTSFGSSWQIPHFMFSTYCLLLFPLTVNLPRGKEEQHLLGWGSSSTQWDILLQLSLGFCICT